MSDCIIETRGLIKRYGDQVSVSNLDLHVQKGRIYGLLGRNGAGKTTTMKMLLGLTAPTSGTVSLFGQPLKGNETRILPRIGSLIESPGFYPNLTGTENLQIFARLRGLKSPNYIKSALELVNLPYRDKKRYAQYSLGMKQRLAIALAVMHDPELLILDEPINGLDPEGIVEFRELLLRLNRERQTTILISSHILSELSALATHYAFIDRGRMLETISAADLRERCRDCLELRVDDAARAAHVLEEQLGTRDFEVLPQERLRLYAFLDQPQTVNRVLMEQGVGLISAQQKDSNLEDYFLSLIDGHSAGKEGV